VRWLVFALGRLGGDAVDDIADLLVVKQEQDELRSLNVSTVIAGFSASGRRLGLRTQFLDVDDLRVATHLARAMDQVLRAARAVRGAVGQRDQRHLFR